MHEVTGIVNVITAEYLHNRSIAGIHASNKQSEYIPMSVEADLCARVHTYELSMHTSARSKWRVRLEKNLLVVPLVRNIINETTVNNDTYRDQRNCIGDDYPFL